MPTIRDIADKAGVSPGLVSLALNGKPRVSPGTADRIIKIANALGYRRRTVRPAGAGSLRFVRLFRASSPFHTSHASFFANYIEGAEDYLKRRGYRFEVSSHPVERVEEVSRTLADDGLQGAILLATELTRDEIAVFESFPLPLVVLDASHDFLSLDRCTMNNRDAIHLAVTTLREMGHRRIGVVASDNSIQTYNLASRFRAFALSMELNGLPNKTGWCYRAPIDPARAALSLAGAFRKRPPPPALVCLTDNAAYGCLQALSSLGIGVPDDVSVVGFDDLPTSEVMQPPLTTLRVPTRAMGAAAARLLDARIADPAKPFETVLFGCDLVMRKSVREMQ